MLFGNLVNQIGTDQARSVFGVMCSIGPLFEPAHVITFAHCEGNTADLSSTFVVTVSETGGFPGSDVGSPVINVVLNFS